MGVIAVFAVGYICLWLSLGYVLLLINERNRDFQPKKLYEAAMTGTMFAFNIMTVPLFVFSVGLLRIYTYYEYLRDEITK